MFDAPELQDAPRRQREIDLASLSRRCLGGEQSAANCQASGKHREGTTKTNHGTLRILRTRSGRTTANPASEPTNRRRGRRTTCGAETA